MAQKSLILETSQRIGSVALADGDTLLRIRHLEEARRHARDLAPFCRQLLGEQGWKPKDLGAVIVSLGPGSYTGLRVGVMSAKTLAYATGCTLLGIETFHALAHQAPPEATTVEILEDAQQGRVYAQRFHRTPEGWQPAHDLRIVSFDDWQGDLDAAAWISGPALETLAARLQASRLVPRDLWRPRPESFLHLGLLRLRRREKDDVFALEPLYLRPSHAEQQWK